MQRHQSKGHEEAPLYIGIDLGTTGCRGVAIDGQLTIHAQSRYPLPPPRRNGTHCEQDPQLWLDAVLQVLGELAGSAPARGNVTIAIDGTSGTLVLTDACGIPLAPALMYNDARSTAQAQRIAVAAPARSGAHGPSSSLAKLLYFQEQTQASKAGHALHQAEWIAGRLIDRYDTGDENNCLKLGYDVLTRSWPEWIQETALNLELLPAKVVPPGTTLGTISTSMARLTGLPVNTKIVAGTTDGVAAFLATGAARAGEAVTSLGSTLVLKILAEQPIFAPEYGVYSHRLGTKWLAGGASNSGGAVLLQHFTTAQLEELSLSINPDEPTGLDYYPLPAPGERFPVNDPGMKPRLTPRPAEPARFLQALLEGIARIEETGYRTLARLGAPYPVSIRSVGGGARNAAWTRIREHQLQIPLIEAKHQDAAYGSALLARGRPLQ